MSKLYKECFFILVVMNLFVLVSFIIIAACYWSYSEAAHPADDPPSHRTPTPPPSPIPPTPAPSPTPIEFEPSVQAAKQRAIMRLRARTQQRVNELNSMATS